MASRTVDVRLGYYHFQEGDVMQSVCPSPLPVRREGTPLPEDITHRPWSDIHIDATGTAQWTSAASTDVPTWPNGSIRNTNFQSFHARKHWKKAYSMIVRQLSLRKIWAYLGQKLRRWAPLYQHLERRQGVLEYRVLR